MNLVQVDSVRTQAAQAVFTCIAQVVGITMLCGHLACDENLVSPPLQRLAQHFLRMPVAIYAVSTG